MDIFLLGLGILILVAIVYVGSLITNYLRKQAIIQDFRNSVDQAGQLGLSVNALCELPEELAMKFNESGVIDPKSSSSSVSSGSTRDLDVPAKRYRSSEYMQSRNMDEMRDVHP